MDAHVKEVVRAVTTASNENSLPFPAVVKALAEVGVERYHADLVVGAKTYFMPNGDCETVASHTSKTTADAFNGDAVEAALRAIQRGAISYTTFCDRIAEAGCVGYFVSLKGKRALYYGRTNDVFVEWFPGARP
ncbi:MAG: DUF1398 family protein [Roseiarcus sp.]|jgi:uncharacterized protein YbcV (DUF1398 family)|uniref:DUF1398 domain-containing protein n=1 Tax=Roseiarcus sp. TaxID=1969460 RepID=UPI003C219798